MRRRPGEVRDAILAFLRSKRADATVGEIHRAVETTLGSKIPTSSVRSYLRLNSGDLFVREKRGRYRLRQS
jgi:site-specific DNA-methyltransferase (adenine-specific)